MKNWKHGIIGIIAVIALTACNEGNNETNQTPTADDFNISGTETDYYEGQTVTVTITAKEGKTSGAITVKYNGNTAAPATAGDYTVTFDVAASTGWNTANGLAAGTLTVIGMPAFTNIFSFMTGVVPVAQGKISTAFSAIFNTMWVTVDGRQLLLDLAAKTSKIQVVYMSNTDTISIAYYTGGALVIAGDLDAAYPVDFADQLKAKLIEARDDDFV